MQFKCSKSLKQDWLNALQFLDLGPQSLDSDIIAISGIAYRGGDARLIQFSVFQTKPIWIIKNWVIWQRSTVENASANGYVQCYWNIYVRGCIRTYVRCRRPPR